MYDDQVTLGGCFGGTIKNTMAFWTIASIKDVLYGVMTVGTSAMIPYDSASQTNNTKSAEAISTLLDNDEGDQLKTASESRNGGNIHSVC